MTNSTLVGAAEVSIRSRRKGKKFDGPLSAAEVTAWREELNMAQEEFAAHFEVSLEDVQRWEKHGLVLD